MDCPAEEQLVRIKLDDFKNIKSLNFDLSNRILTVYHQGDHEQIFQKLESLRLDTSLIGSTAIDTVADSSGHNRERILLWQVLSINFFFFILEIVAGFIANSMGLVADSLDMLADSVVYGLALFAVGGTITRKKNVTKLSGLFQLTLTFFGFAEVLRRFLGLEPVPAYEVMIVISVLALIGNTVSLLLLQKSKSREAHMQASMIFTSNDVIANLGVIIAGVLVYLMDTKYPDLIIGIIVFAAVGRGAIRILQLSK
jgi:Co/Zn/Cd efflux system component